MNLPYRAAGRFVGRGPGLGELDAAGAPLGSVIVQGARARRGRQERPGGALGRHADRRFRVVWWNTTDTPTLLDEGLAGLAVALDPASAGRGLRELTERAIAWLTAHESWLLILDDVARPADVEPLLSRLRGGRVLITSRLAGNWHPLAASVVRLDVLRPAQAVALLTGVATGRSGAEIDGAEELCAELGFPPLAIGRSGRSGRLAGLACPAAAQHGPAGARAAGHRHAGDRSAVRPHRAVPRRPAGTRPRHRLPRARAGRLHPHGLGGEGDGFDAGMLEGLLYGLAAGDLVAFPEPGENYHYGRRTDLKVGDTEAPARKISGRISCHTYPASCPGATIADGLAVRGEEVEGACAEIEAWLRTGLPLV